MRLSESTDLWWKNAVIYCLDPETFLDSDGDGIGDLTGVIDRVDHLEELGVTCVWLMPIHPSPNLDDGYDIVDHYGVDPRLGSPGDMAVLIRMLHDRGMRVIMDLVVNHTSIEHPWFQDARRSRESRFRDFYVWTDDPDGEPEIEPTFPGEDDTVWTWDEQAGQYYLHHFYSHQADLNLRNDDVVDEIAKIIGYWLQLGVDGFRVDAVPFLAEPEGIEEGSYRDPHDLFRDLRAYMGRRSGDAIFLGEVNLPPDDAVKYFGNGGGDELHLVFGFSVMQATYLALARRDARPLRHALRRVPRAPEDGQWVNFVRNHDELTLDQLTDAAREEVFAAFAPDPGMRIYGRGIRRRLPPMLDGHDGLLRMCYSLVLSLPGVPALFYGEEIGMGENLDLPGRMAVRSPMQWDGSERGGFSAGGATDLERDPPSGPFGPATVNVADQHRVPGSFLTWISAAIRCRRQAPEFGWGEVEVIDVDAPGVLVVKVSWEHRTTYTVHNFADATGTVRLDVAGTDDVHRVTELLGATGKPPQLANGTLTIKVRPFDYRWIRLESSPQPPP